MLKFLLSLAVVDGVRHQKTSSKTILGVKVHNYDLAFNNRDLVEGEEDWVVVLKRGATDSQISNICQRAKTGCKISGHPSEHGVPFLEISGSEVDLQDALGPVADTIAFIEPDVPMMPTPEVEEPTSAAALVQKSGWDGVWGLERVGVPSRPTIGEGVHIYVTDTGVRWTHKDFGGRVVPTLDMTSGTAQPCGSDMSCADDNQGHGTHCAGTAGGTKYGVASGATIHSVRVFTTGEAPMSWSYGALDWIAAKGERPAVASMSLGGKGLIEAMRIAVEAAVEAGVTVVAAGGNDGVDACQFSPAFVPVAITVGATDPGNSRWVGSNFGACVDIWAPGAAIKSLNYHGDDIYKDLTGTSMACPHVAGGAALVLEASPSFSPAQVLAELLDHAASDSIYAGLSDNDANKLLWVGAGEAPPPTPLTCPTGTMGPDQDNECRCMRGSCYQAGNYGCACTSGQRCSKYFAASCYNCKCMR